MHALSKKHYYDILKSGHEDTILESDLSKVNCDREDTDVGCYARPHLRSHATQTHLCRSKKNFRNEYTITSDVDSVLTSDLQDKSSHRAQSFINCSRSYEDVTVIRNRGPQTAGIRNHENPLINSGIPAPKFFVESAVACVQCFGIGQKLSAQESKATKTENFGDDVSIQCAPKMSACYCDEYKYIPCNRGLAACRTFTLGPLESRRFQNEQCKTKLIGGCRVPVCKSYKNRF